MNIQTDDLEDDFDYSIEENRPAKDNFDYLKTDDDI
jgi:hypothetical protein